MQADALATHIDALDGYLKGLNAMERPEFPGGDEPLLEPARREVLSGLSAQYRPTKEALNVALANAKNRLNLINRPRIPSELSKSMRKIRRFLRARN
jgi:hypothetical protein